MLLVPRQAVEVVRLVRTTIGDDLVAACLHGSAVSGGLRPDSDLDILAVTTRSLGEDERRALVAGLLPLSGRGRRTPDDRSIELVSVVRDDVVPWRYRPVMDFLYGDWERPAYLEGFVPAAHPAPDLAMLLTVARGAGHPLLGPPLASLLDPVPPADLRRALVDEVPGLLADLADGTRNVLLTLARVWLTLDTGDIRPKDVAADFAAARLASDADRAVLAHARAIYMGDAEERWEGPLADGVGPCADGMLAEIRRLAGEARPTR